MASVQQASFLMNTYGDPAVGFTHGDGAWLYDTNGRRYLDCLAGIAVNTLGHAHPTLVAALREQVGQVIHTSNLYRIERQQQLASMLVERSAMTNAFFCNSGLEANEAAIKIARLYGHNKGIAEPKIIVFDNAFHGRSMATLSATGNPKVQKGFEPLLEGFVRVPLNDEAAIEQAAASEPGICAVFIESIQGEGGIHPASVAYLQFLRQICDTHGWLLMIDEVQCGTGRTGKWFAHQWAGIKADVVPIAKGLGSGVPIGAVLAHGEAAHTFQPGTHGTTFGGNPLAMRAGVTTIEVIEQENLLTNAQQVGGWLLEQLHQAFDGKAGVREVRGQGLMIGVELEHSCPEVVGKALEAGLILNVTAGSVVRLLPPLILTQEQAAMALEILIPLIHEQLAKTN
ncbi:MAG: aspartate aminotransferase family protein [Burkholderiaceae bacterium]